MLNTIIDWAVRNRLFVLLGLIATLFVSAFAIPTLKLDAFPDVTNVQKIGRVATRGFDRVHSRHCKTRAINDAPYVTV